MRQKNKPYNNGTWTQARFNSFIKSGLRSLSRKWGPIHSTLKKAWVKRGIYYCAGYNRDGHNVRLSSYSNGKRVRNVFIDHINPVISNQFISWDNVIKRMFVEETELQVLCKECHDKKTKEERIKKNDKNGSSR